jgi:hypothetical protein
MRRLVLFLIGFLACLWLVLAGPAEAAGRRVAILIDTSGSMVQTDPQRYTVQLSQIIADILDDSDELTVVRLRNVFLVFCSGGPSSSLSIRLDPRRRSAFKSGIDGLIAYDGNNDFASAIRTAMQALSLDPGKKRMLLMIADSGGLDPCAEPLTRELVRLHDSGAVVAAVNIGSTTGAFENNPAFDFTTPAQDPQELVNAVAEVYQRFLGARKVQTGTVRSGIEVEIDPFVREAYLVVAADGPVGRLEQGPGNPGARALDLDHRGGGETQGLDGRRRGYRIVRFERPGPGRWHFRAPGLSADAAWVLIQEDTLGVRLVSPGKVAEGANVLEAELYDTETGQPVRDLAKVPGAGVSIEVDGREIPLRDDGSGGDRTPGDGIFSASHDFQGTGKRDLSMRLKTRNIDRVLTGGLEVMEAGWRVVPPPPQKATLGEPVPLKVDLQPVGAPGAPRVPPEKIDIKVDGTPEGELRDRGGEGGLRRYEGSWTPRKLGPQDVELAPVGGSPAVPATARVEVLGSLEFGAPVPVRFGRLKSGGEGSATLDLSPAKVKGGFDLEVTSAFGSSGSQLEMETPAGWVPLGRKPVQIRLEDGGARSWPLRLRVGSCPADCEPSEVHRVVVSGAGPDGKPRRLEVPLTAEVVPDPWLVCWWPVLAAVGLAALTGFLIYGFWSPSRFAPRIGVQISPEPDMSEGFFHPIRGARGSGSGFYRDAMIYVGNFELTPRPGSALARLRAHRNQVRLQPMNGGTLWRQTQDGEWDQVAAGEATVRSGVIYRNDH